jgi:hypothetical protein
VLSEAFGPRAAIVTSTGLIVVAAVVAWLVPFAPSGSAKGLILANKTAEIH